VLRLVFGWWLAQANFQKQRNGFRALEGATMIVLRGRWCSPCTHNRRRSVLGVLLSVSLLDGSWMDGLILAH
jgi:hypothetical protein